VSIVREFGVLQPPVGDIWITNTPVDIRTVVVLPAIKGMA
jgi:hypothetical protein